MQDSISSSATLDKPALLLYLVLIGVGWLSIYASGYSGLAESTPAFYDLSTRAGRQLMWMAVCLLPIAFHLLLSYRGYDSFAYLFYGIGILLLLGVLFLGKEVSGSRSWFDLGPVHVQPSELVKYTTLLALARFLGGSQFQPHRLRDQAVLLLIIGLPVLLIIWQGDTGTAMVYSSLLLVTYRGGMSPAIMLGGTYLVVLFVLVLFVKQLFLITGIVAVALLVAALIGKRAKRAFFVAIAALLTVGFVIGLEFAMQRMLKPYQYKRIQAVINPEGRPFWIRMERNAVQNSYRRRRPLRQRLPTRHTDKT